MNLLAAKNKRSRAARLYQIPAVRREEQWTTPHGSDELEYILRLVST